jgi:hypothetical protein
LARKNGLRLRCFFLMGAAEHYPFHSGIAK